MDKLILEVTEVEAGSAKEVRAEGRVPIVYYGKGVENKYLSADYQDFRRTYEKGGRSTILYFKTEKEEYPVLVQDIQYEPVSDEFIHVDVMAVDLKQTIRTQVPVVLVGEAPAVRELAGVLVQSKDKVEVECLPKDLLPEIELDISSLVDFNTSLTVADLKVPDTITILDAEDIGIATVSAPRAAIEEEEEAAPAEGEEAPAEGEEAPAEGGAEEEKKEE